MNDKKKLDKLLDELVNELVKSIQQLLELWNEEHVDKDRVETCTNDILYVLNTVRNTNNEELMDLVLSVVDKNMIEVINRMLFVKDNEGIVGCIESYAHMIWFINELQKLHFSTYEQ